MLATLLLLAVPKVPVGSYGMPELCDLLSQVTGKPHVADSSLIDYPVFVSVKSGDPVRIEKLVASAFHAQWVEQNGRLRLKPIPPKKNEDFAEFQRLYRKACKGNAIRLQLPTEDLYKMIPGEVIRYGTTPGPNIRPLPPALAASNDADSKWVILVRMGPGVYQFGASGDDQIQFSGLSPEAEALLGDEKSKEVLSQEDRNRLAAFSKDPRTLKVDWVKATTRDPVATLQDLVLPHVAKAMTHDLVMAIPDLTVFSLVEIGGVPPTVSGVLGDYSVALDWIAVDGALVGRVTDGELQHPAQAKRSVLAKYVAAIGRDGIANVTELSQYVDDQRPASSDSWMDVVLLSLAGVVADQQYIGDYPFNMRLYTSLDRQDWALIRSGQPFAASAFSGHVQSQLMDLLLQSRTRTSEQELRSEESEPDPAKWHTLDLSQLSVKATLDQEPILIDMDPTMSQVSSIEDSAMRYDSRRGNSSQEPLYRTGSRQRLKLIISSPIAGETVTTGFSEVKLVGEKAVAWTQLPADIAAKFKKALDSWHKREAPGVVGKPPPNAFPSSAR